MKQNYDQNPFEELDALKKVLPFLWTLETGPYQELASSEPALTGLLVGAGTNLFPGAPTGDDWRHSVSTQQTG